VEGLGILPEVPDTSESRAAHQGRLYLLPERSLFHSGSTTRKSKAILSVSQEPYLAINPIEAERLGLNGGDTVKVKTARGSAVVTLKLVRDVPEGAVMLSNTFEKVNFNALVGCTVDPVLGCMVLSDNEVSIEKV
jgi:anaerobic selenocysteine-containing dehydrogenase